MLLVIDVGNTNTVYGVYSGDRLEGSWRMSTMTDRTSDEIGILLTQYLQSGGISPKQISGVAISSVVPPVMHSLLNAVRKYIGKEPLLVDHSTPLGIDIQIDNPRELGADRLVNAYAALALYPDRNLIIVDFGTATTFCAVTEDRQYLGGVICAGMKISMEALFARASKLPRVEIARTENIIGKNTRHSMQSGAINGYVGQVDHIVEGIRRELPGAYTVATGGLSRLIAEESKGIDTVNSSLTLEGLRLIYESKER